MELSAIGRAALESREGNVLTAYKDSVGVWTISVGVTTASGLIKVTPGLKITAAQSDELFAKAVLKYVKPVVDALGPKINTITQNEFDAFVSICYNIGPVNFAHSTFLRKFMAGDKAGCAEAILQWNKPASILTRRRAERLQFLTPYSVSLPKGRDSDAKPIALPKGGVIPVPPAAAPAPAPAPSPGIWALIKQRFAR
jgi:lysozyme